MSMFITKSTSNLTMLSMLDKYMVGHSGYIAGGVFKHILSKERLKDVDIFFNSIDDFNKAVLFYDTHCEEYEFVYSNDKAVSYKHIDTNTTLDLVKSITGTPEEVLSQFDFTVTKMAYLKSFEDEDEIGEVTTVYKVTYHEDYFQHLVTKSLVIDENIPFPTSTWERTYRYFKYGYKLCRESKKKLIKALRDVTDREVENISMYNDGGWD